MSSLGFVIEDRGNCRCVVWDNGGVSPATLAECALWDALHTQPPAVGVDVSESLPALPRPWGTDYDDIDNEEVETFTASQMKAYARAALTAALRTGGGE